MGTKHADWPTISYFIPKKQKVAARWEQTEANKQFVELKMCKDLGLFLEHRTHKERLRKALRSQGLTL